jgi:general L-amino acid transport system permease protein
MRSGTGHDIRAVLWQALAFGLMGAVVFVLLRTTSANLHARGIASGFGFLDAVARVSVSNASLPFESGVDTYGRALLIGIANTMKIALAAMVLATVIGVPIGAGRLSVNPMVRAVCTTYVELMRNVPVLLHIFLWYQIALSLPGQQDDNLQHWLILSNRGLYLPAVGPASLLMWTGAACVVAISGRYFLKRRPAASGSGSHPPLAPLALWLLALVPWLIAGHGPSLELPVVDGLEVVGGLTVSPEYAALLIGISTYTAAFIAEIVRGAVLAVPIGQWEAARSVGLSESKAFRRIVMPQALRVAIPPATSEYLGVLKNSSLAIAIGYQDVVAMGNSILFETGQAIEVVGLVMFFYVMTSLVVSALMGSLNRHMALVER